MNNQVRVEKFHYERFIQFKIRVGLRFYLFGPGRGPHESLAIRSDLRYNFTNLLIKEKKE